jgi:ABC-2 type transport system permease protein
MNIFKQEFKMLYRSVATWSVSIAVLFFVFMALFPSFAKQAEIINEALKNFPPQLLAAFGMTGVDLSTVLGFFGFLFLFAQICLAIQASNYGFGMVSVEEREWTADFLLSKPVTRSSVLSAKLFASLAALAITDVLVWTAAFIAVGAFNGGRSYDAGRLVLLLATVPVFQLFFLSVGLVVSLLVKRVRSVTPYSMGLAFGMYVLVVFSDLLGTAVFEKITPFKHFEPNYILANGNWDWPLVAISATVIVVSIAASYLRYNRRDIPAVA